MLRAYGDGNMFGEPYGEGPVRVVWLHGWGRRSQDFTDSAQIVARAGHASVAIELPGFGVSPEPDVVGGARHYAELLLPAIRGLGSDPVVIVGHSFGGRVAVAFAAAHPELVKALVLTGVPLLRQSATRRPPFAYLLIRWMHGKGLIGERRMEEARQRFGSTDYRNARGVMRDVLVVTVNESYEDELTRLTCPVTLLWGANDAESPVDVASRSQRLLAAPHSLRVLEGVGHLVPTSAPGDLAQVVLETILR